MEAHVEVATAKVKLMRVDPQDAARRREMLAKLCEKTSQTAISERTGISLAQINQWLTGHRNMTEGSAKMIARKLSLRADYFDTPETDVEVRFIPTATIPVVGDVKAGADGFLEEYGYPTGAGSHIIHRVTTDPHSYALRIRGDSMQPKYDPGDFIIVEPSREAQAGDIVVVKLVDGRKLVKKLLYRRNGELTLGSINQDYRTLTFAQTEVESVHFVGGVASANSTMVREVL